MCVCVGGGSSPNDFILSGSLSLLKARNQEDAEEGWYLMQEIIKAMDAQKAMAGGVTREAKQVWILSPEVEDDKILVGPALFGPDLGGEKDFQVFVKLSRFTNGCKCYTVELLIMNSPNVMTYVPFNIIPTSESIKPLNAVPTLS